MFLGSIFKMASSSFSPTSISFSKMLELLPASDVFIIGTFVYSKNYQAILEAIDSGTLPSGSAAFYSLSDPTDDFLLFAKVDNVLDSILIRSSDSIQIYNGYFLIANPAKTTLKVIRYV